MPDRGPNFGRPPNADPVILCTLIGEALVLLLHVLFLLGGTVSNQ
jgi:hypothetical protein